MHECVHFIVALCTGTWLNGLIATVCIVVIRVYSIYTWWLIFDTKIKVRIEMLFSPESNNVSGPVSMHCDDHSVRTQAHLHTRIHTAHTVCRWHKPVKSEVLERIQAYECRRRYCSYVTCRAHTRIHIHTQQQSDFISETISVEPDEFTYLYLYTQFLFINTNKLYHPQSKILLRHCTHYTPTTIDKWAVGIQIVNIIYTPQ